MTRSFNLFARTAAVAAFLSFAGTAFALPSDRTITYSIRETPTNESSPVLWTITLHLHAALGYGSSVGWQVTQIDFRRTNGENPDSLWSDNNPEFNDTENLWWITHGNPSNPAARDFDNFPFTTRTATVVSNAANDLDYELETAASSSGLFSGSVADITYIIDDGVEGASGEVEPAQTE